MNKPDQYLWLKGFSSPRGKYNLWFQVLRYSFVVGVVWLPCLSDKGNWGKSIGLHCGPFAIVVTWL
jgi:hypothetical protein